MRMIAAPSAGQAELPPSPPVAAPPTVQQVYEAHFAFVWRSARRLGMRPPQLEDVVQEVFMVVQRRLREFEGRSALRTWLFAITRHVVRAHFRLNARGVLPFQEERADEHSRGPESQLLLNEDARLLHALLAELDDEEREVFVLAQLEEMSGPEIAQALELPVRSVYSRIVAAQKSFEKALRRARARERRRP